MGKFLYLPLLPSGALPYGALPMVAGVDSPPPPPPEEPAEPLLAATALSNRSIRLEFVAGAGTSELELHRSTEGVNFVPTTLTLLAEVYPFDREYLDTNVQPNRVYYYILRAKNAGGVTDSDTASASTERVRFGRRSSREAGFVARGALSPHRIIETARDRHPLFVRERHPDAALLRALSGEERRMVAKLLAVNPSAIAESTTFALADYDFSLGHYLPAHHLIHAVTLKPVNPQADSFPAILCNWHNRLDTTRPLSYAIHGNTLFLARTAEHWKEIERVDISYAPIPNDLVRLTDDLVLPDNAESYLVAFLAQFMGLRQSNPALTPTDLLQLAQERDDAEKDFLAAWKQQATARVIRKYRRL